MDRFSFMEILLLYIGLRMFVYGNISMESDEKYYIICKRDFHFIIFDFHFIIFDIQ